MQYTYIDSARAYQKSVYTASPSNFGEKINLSQEKIIYDETYAIAEAD